MLVHSGPVSYLSHHEVHKPDCKINGSTNVLDSSASHIEFPAAGPACLNNVFGILL